MHIPKTKIKNISFDSSADGSCSLCRTNLFLFLGKQLQRTPASKTATRNRALTKLTSLRQLLGRPRAKAVSLHYNGRKWERRENGFTFQVTHISLSGMTILNINYQSRRRLFKYSYSPVGEIHLAPRYKHLLSANVVDNVVY